MPDYYKIIGGDRKEYGPVSAEELTRWLAEGRLNTQSQVRLEGTLEWRPLSSFPELAQAAGIPATPPPLAPSLVTVVSQGWVEQVLARRPRVQIGRCLARSRDLWLSNFGLLSAASFLIWLLSLIEFVPLIGLLYHVFAGALYGGLYLVFLKRVRGQTAAVVDTFGGFGQRFGQLALAGFISWLLTQLGILFCVLPGLYLMVGWCFCLPLVADRGLEFWTAMELSRKVVTRVWFPMFGLLFVALLPVILATVFAAIRGGQLLFDAMHKLVVAGPPSLGAVLDTMVQVERQAFPLALLIKTMVLLNLPFVIGALMCAYEDLFGARPEART